MRFIVGMYTKSVDDVKVKKIVLIIFMILGDDSLSQN